MVNILILIATAVSLGAQNITGGVYLKKTPKANAYMYPCFVAIAVFLFFVFYGRFSYSFNGKTVLFSLFFAASYCLYFICQLAAMKCGPVSLTSLIMSYSLIIPTVTGLIVYREKVGVWFFVGLALLAISLFFINNGKKQSDERSGKADDGGKKGKVFLKWGLLCLFAFIGNGMCSVFQTMQQKACDGAFKAEFMMTAMIAVVAVSLSCALISSRKTVLDTVKKGWWLGGLCGVFNAVVNLSVMILIAVLPVSLVFPTLSAGSLLFTYALSVFMFKERLNLKQNIGFIAGVLSVILLNL